MGLKILIDESVDFRIAEILINKGFNIISILKNYPGISDKKVLELAKNYKALLLTEDKDFGEWIFAHKEKSLGVIYLRYKYPEYKNVSNSLAKILNEYGESLYNKFTVITPKKIRIRKL
ncbi:DUF5615 family PIN-like protein [Candidatus Aminicenantes bacterium AC-335-K20]|nr:DUF5615 family PIN-like protein [SCandidatus Aminicenantes bacterium Aminicenantia_JdfR_composite]MCP2596553.1 DUF5615 family PIN-like protein [Candidatus Aminicenantes bacterium AC-335-G13]MCP2598319.1 DUF5615 family PIN-like protein [Candidatus Aminicenantes bacterium AC-335-L06]MCP2605441.1 DUF5615 family PIN-like protein [Candidatus Aminicenantes bacterium AC-335-O07]MCP2606112.1 DUF5615 family PIN-like protein [Candidatus Aminicenantes bacterium AC-708-I09]MCP2618250.1 DUF5615 family P